MSILENMREDRSQLKSSLVDQKRESKVSRSINRQAELIKKLKEKFNKKSSEGEQVEFVVQGKTYKMNKKRYEELVNRKKISPKSPSAAMKSTSSKRRI